MKSGSHHDLELKAWCDIWSGVGILTHFCVKTQVRSASCLYKRPTPLRWQSTDSKVTIWNLGPFHRFFKLNFSQHTLTPGGCSLSVVLSSEDIFRTSFFGQIMAFLISLVFLSSWTAAALTLPRNTFDNMLKGSRAEFESSGRGPDEPVQGLVKVVQLDPRALAQSGFFRKGLTPRRAPSFGPRMSFPAFLSQGRPGPAPAPRAAVSPLHHLHSKSPTEVGLKKRQGLQMWQRAVDKGDKTTMNLPGSLKDAKQTCSALPFTQVRGKDFCAVLESVAFSVVIRKLSVDNT